MNQICLVVALFCSVVLSEEVVRNPKLVLRQHQRHYLNITNGVYMLLVIERSIGDLHWEKQKSSRNKTKKIPVYKRQKVATGTEDSYFIGSPPPPSLPPPLTLSHIQFQAYCALHQGETTVDSL